MKSRRTFALILAGGASIIAALAWLHTGYTAGDSQRQGPAMKRVEVRRGELSIIVSANGVVRPIDRIELKSKASGEIVNMVVEQGDLVRRGALIARLDQKDEKAAVAQGIADLDIAKAELTQAQRNYQRRDQLFKTHSISAEDLDTIVLDLARAKAHLVQAQTTLDRARERFDESVITAPIDGIILQKYVEKGQIIASGVSNVGGGTSIADIADMSSVQVVAGIDEVDIGKVGVGQAVTVVAEAYPGVEYAGKIVRISPEARLEQNVTLFDVVIEVANADGRLKSGMNAAVSIEVLRRPDVLLIPAIALRTQPGMKSRPGQGTVLLQSGDDFEPHRITTGVSNYRQIEVLTGLEAGDVLGIPMRSRLKADNDRLQSRIRSSRGFGAKKKSGK